MGGWIAQHSTVLTVSLQGVTALVWLVYLQIFLTGLWRQRRPMILVTLSGGRDEEARCFVVNLGAEPIYLLAMICEFPGQGPDVRAFVTDRAEFAEQSGTPPFERTAQRPLNTGDYVDIGSFGEILERARSELEWGESGAVETLRLTALCTLGPYPLLVGGQRNFRIGGSADRRLFLAEAADTHQIRSRRERRALRNKLNRYLEREIARGVPPQG